MRDRMQSLCNIADREKQTETETETGTETETDARDRLQSFCHIAVVPRKVTHGQPHL